MERSSRREFLLAAVTSAAIAGCSSNIADPASTRSPNEAGEFSTPTADSPAKVGGFPLADRQLPLPMSRESLREKARSGGPPKDGIPSIDAPKFGDASLGDTNLEPDDPVFGVARGGEAKAYPQNILVHHEICNDSIAGDPVSVTYCPLTGTAQGFERGRTGFGVSGRLLNSNLVMYDWATDAWWPQMLATSIPGPWNESPGRHTLREFRVVWTTWGRWKAQYPGTKVLSRDTGYFRDYDRDPYGSYNPREGYYASSGLLFPALHYDDRYQEKQVVLGARSEAGAAAFLKDALRRKGTLSGSIGDVPVVAVYDSRLDTGHVYRNPEERSVTVDGETARVDGESHEPDDLPLDAIVAYDAMWFAWVGYYPDTNVYE